MLEINNNFFIDVNIAAMCYYQNRYNNINKNHISPEQKIIDNLDLYYQFDGDVTVEIIPESKKDKNGYESVRISRVNTLKYNGLLKFCNKPSIDEDFKHIYFSPKKRFFSTTSFCDITETKISPNSTVIDFQKEAECTADTITYYKHSIYVKLNDLIDFSLINGIELDGNFYAPILLDSYLFQDYLENITNPNITASEIINYRDELIGFTSVITKDQNLYTTKETIYTAVNIWNSKDERLDNYYFNDELKNTDVPYLNDLEDLLLGRLKENEQQVTVQQVINLFESLPFTEENNVIIKNQLPEIWLNALCELTSNKNNPSCFEEDDTPDALYYAYDVYKQVWAGFDPKTTNKPPLIEVKNFIKQKGITDSTIINSIIALSKPPEINYGGKASENKKQWQLRNKVK